MSRLLIVEDELHLAQGLLFNLEAEGHEVSAVENGESALKLLLTRGERFDAMILDIMLPGANGFEVAERLRAAGNYVPILMLTARSRPEDVLKGFASGADDYLPKPFELSILIARVHSLLRRTQWQRRPAAKERQRQPHRPRLKSRDGAVTRDLARAVAAPPPHELLPSTAEHSTSRPRS